MLQWSGSPSTAPVMLREPVEKTVGAVAAAIKVNSKASYL